MTADDTAIMTPREHLAEADRCRRIAKQAQRIIDGLSIKGNRAHDIGGVTLRSHVAYKDDVILLDRIQQELERVVKDYTEFAEMHEGKVVVRD